MDAELKAKWVAALRSGQFEQFRDGYCDRASAPSRFCCIGLAGYLLSLGFANYSGVSYAYNMAKEVQDKLIYFNDKEEKSFVEIANWIETHDLQTGEPL